MNSMKIYISMWELIGNDIRDLLTGDYVTSNNLYSEFGILGDTADFSSIYHLHCVESLVDANDTIYKGQTSSINWEIKEQGLMS